MQLLLAGHARQAAIAAFWRQSNELLINQLQSWCLGLSIKHSS
jgi:hypothetical protein